MLHTNFLLILSPCCLAVCGHHLSPRIAIVFSLLSSLPNFYIPHSSNFLSLKHHALPCIFHIFPLCELYSIDLPQGHICAISSSSRLLAYLFLLSGRSRSPTRNRSFSVLRCSLGGANTFSFQILLLTSRKYLSVPPLSPCFLALAFPLFKYLRVPPLSPSFLALAFPLFLYVLLLLSCTPQISLWTVSLLPPTSFHTFSTTLSHLIPARHFVTFSHTAVKAGNLFFGIFFTLYCHINFVTSLFVFKWVHSQFLLVVLEHPSTFLAAAICTVSSCFTNCAFPSHTSPAYSSFGTITFIRIHLLVLVTRCESVKIV